MKRKSPLHKKKATSSSKKTPTKKKRKKKVQTKSSAKKKYFLLKIFSAFLLIFIFYVLYLDFEVRSQFDGKKWSVPARVYARPLELYVGKPLSTEQFDFELKNIRLSFVKR